MTLEDLGKCIEILIQLARSRGLSEITISDPGSYWTVTAPEWTEMYKDPALAVGSFSDDEQALHRLLLDPTRASSVDFDRAAHLLRLVSDRLAF